MSNVEVVILVFGIVLVLGGMLIIEELINRFIFKRKMMTIAIPSDLYLRLRKEAKAYGCKPDSWIHDNIMIALENYVGDEYE